MADKCFNFKKTRDECDCWTDAKGERLKVGDRISFKTFPKGTARGTLAEGRFFCGDCGRPAMVGVEETEGKRYSPLPSKGVRKLLK